MSVTARRLTAVLLIAAATAGVWVAVPRGGTEGTVDGDDSPGASAPVAELAREMDDTERIDQLLLVGFDGTAATDSIVAPLRDHELGGVIFGAPNYSDPEQLAGLVRILRTVSAGSVEGDEPRIPILAAAAQEGGEHRAFADLPPEATQLEVGDGGSIAEAEEWAQATGSALREAGIDLNLFPVVDVATLDSPLADRAFSDDPGAAAALTAAAVRGCRASGIGCAPLHFPGLGGASQATEAGPATVGLDRATLAARDLEPFRAAFAEQVPAVVLSHAFYAAYDAVTPASLTEAIATGLLRNELGFTGVAITDDLGAAAIRSTYEPGEAAVAAVAAGADMVRVDSPADRLEVREALLDAARSGALESRRLAEAAGRVIELKAALGLVELN